MNATAEEIEREIAGVVVPPVSVAVIHKTGYALAQQNRQQRTVHSSRGQHTLAKAIIDNCVC
jgi:hypothetical protein